VKVVNISRKYRIPIIASGGATSLEGHFSGVRLNLNYSSLGYTDGDG
jgi:imidazole glycerol phosphate synthase subunit HisF